VAVLREAGRQTTSRGRRPSGPQASAGPTRVPTPGCRSRPAGLARGRRRNAVATGYRSARSDRPWLEVLDVISVPRSLAAPSGKTYGTNLAGSGSTLLSTRFGPAGDRLSTSYAPLWTERGQPHRNPPDRTGLHHRIRSGRQGAEHGAPLDPEARLCQKVPGGRIIPSRAGRSSDRPCASPRGRTSRSWEGARSPRRAAPSNDRRARPRSS